MRHPVNRVVRSADDGRVSAPESPWWGSAGARTRPPLPPRPPAPSATLRRRWQRAATVLAVVVLGVMTLAVWPRHSSRYRGVATETSDSSGPSTATPAPRSLLPIDKAPVVFSDAFLDPFSGWLNGSLPSGTTFKYQSGHYVAHARGNLHHFANAPYREPLEELAMSVTATQSAHAPRGAGFGVLCRRVSAPRASDTSQYEFIVASSGVWFVERHDGPSASKESSILIEGRSPALPGARPVTVTGVCATEAGTGTTRLQLLVNGQQVADLRDTAASLPGPGWLASLDVDSRAAAPVDVDASLFTIYDLSGAGTHLVPHDTPDTAPSTTSPPS